MKASLLDLTRERGGISKVLDPARKATMLTLMLIKPDACNQKLYSDFDTHHKIEKKPESIVLMGRCQRRSYA